MKIGEVIIVVVITVVLTLGSIWGAGKFNEMNNPQVHVQSIAKDLMADLQDLNKGIDQLYAYQKAHGMKDKKHIAIIVPEDLIKKKKSEPPKPPQAASVPNGPAPVTPGTTK